jgi:DoxX-like family
MSDSGIAARGGMNWWTIALWAAQILLAIGFGAAGVLKLFQPIETLGTMMNWVTVTPDWLVRVIGFV